MAKSLPSTSISCRADKEFVNVLHEIAYRMRKPIADIVRVALDEQYADEIAAVRSFFESDDYKNSQLTIKIDNEKVAQS
jgi:hypothetical protein